jgi:hypothetical protein
MGNRSRFTGTSAGDRQGLARKSFAVTIATGSGKSLCFFLWKFTKSVRKTIAREFVEIAGGIDIFADRRNQGAAKDRIVSA